MAKIYYQYMTQAGYDAIEQQISALKQQRPAKVARLKAARALGDLSENTEYSTAKRELRHLDSRLRYLNKQLQYAKIMTPTDTKTVEIGTTVTITYLDDAEEVTYTMVGHQEADLAEHKLSYASPLGSAILHQPTDTICTIAAPAGTYQVKINHISL